MTIKEIIKTGKANLSCNMPLKRYTVVNVSYITISGEEEEIQLDLENSPLTKEGIEELSDLFSSLTKEMNTTNESVTYVDIVASAQSKDKLEDMGY